MPGSPRPQTARDFLEGFHEEGLPLLQQGERAAVAEESSLLKGLHAVLDAIAALRAPLHLIVVGHDSRLQSYASHAARLGIGARVHFANGQADVRPFYGAADAFVLPSLYDPFAAAVQEAMAVGLPVVTSTGTGAAELVRHGESGFVCEPSDTNALVAALRQLQSRELRDRMGAAARRTVEPMTLDAMGKQFLDLYAALTGP